MTKSNLYDELYSEYHAISRKLIYLTVGFVAAVAGAVWLLNIDISGNQSTIMGAMFIILAVFTYQTPAITFRYLCKKYKSDEDKSIILGTDSKTFHEAAMQHRYK
ncbi:MAG: hypothetical protein AAF304_09300 [Pseudomonadota bacterium]